MNELPKYEEARPLSVAGAASTRKDRKQQQERKEGTMKKKMTLVATALVLAVLLVGGSVYATSRWDSHSREQLISEIERRDTLIGNQENLLNTYRCLFNVDTQIVPGGCASQAQPTPAPTAAAQQVERHWHCERIINDGSRCDRRFSPGRCWHSHPVDEDHHWNSDTLSC